MVKLAFKVLILGDGAVGKTSIRRKYMGEGFDESHLMTLGADFAQKTIDTIENKIVKLQIWDIAGQDQFKNIRKRFLMKSDGVLLVYDITRTETLVNLYNWLSELWEINNRKDIPVLIIGNKSDLTDARTITYEIASEHVETLRKNHLPDSYIDLIETSARTGVNIDEGFEKITKAMVDLAGE